MPTLVYRYLCTGCATCKAICQHGAIEMVADEEGFLYPYINSAKCIDCRLCEKVCPSLNPPLERKPLGVFAAKAMDGALRAVSSSGGVFSLLADEVLSHGGVVFGAAFNHLDWSVCHRKAEDESGLMELRGSKYIQSDIRECHQEVWMELANARDVLFVGTPCQCVGLKSYLSFRGGVKGRLLLVEIVCHAVPSPLAWRRYLEQRVQEAYSETRTVGEIRRICFRCKDYGWKKYALSLGFVNGKAYTTEFRKDLFMRGFLAELYSRPSCYSCPFKSFRSGVDISIGDYWGVDAKFPDMDDDKGVSLVIVNSEYGQMVFSQITSRMIVKESDLIHVTEANPAIVKAMIPHRNRYRFFRRVMVEDFDRLVSRLLLPPLWSRGRVFLRRILHKLGAWLT